jgi:hypothetical protein
MSKIKLDQVIEVVNAYLQECLPAICTSIPIKKDKILSYGYRIQRAYFLLSDCPGYKIDKHESAVLVQFHGSFKAIHRLGGGRREEIIRDPAVEILGQGNNNILRTLSSSNMTLLLDALRENIKFVPVASVSDPTTGSDIVSIVQALNRRVDRMSTDPPR